MAVQIVTGESWTEDNADNFVKSCRRSDYFENISDEGLKHVYRIADMHHFGIHAGRAANEIAEIMTIDTILHNYWRIGLLNKLLIECRFIKRGEEVNPLDVDLENISHLVKSSVDIDEFLAAINRIESINDYTYYQTKDYWTFVCISDSIFI